MTTMQNVVCPIMIVQIDNEMAAHWNAELSATPVMMPGSASGRINSNEIEARPKNRALCTPKAARVRRMSARIVAKAAALIDSTNAERTCWSCHATEYHVSVQCLIGQV